MYSASFIENGHLRQGSGFDWDGGLVGVVRTGWILDKLRRKNLQEDSKALTLRNSSMPGPLTGNREN